MLRLTHSKRLFSTTIRNKNFFEINPLYPKTGEHQYKLYGARRIRYTPLEHYTDLNNRQLMHDYKLYETLTRNTRLKDKQVASKIIIDAETHLPYGMGFDSYIYAKKGERQIRKLDRRYSENVTKLINRFKTKSEPELVRFFRLALADQRKDDIKEKIKGVVLKNLVLEAARNKNADIIKKYLKNPEEVQKSGSPEFNEGALTKKAFDIALSEIDKKIAQVQENLNIHNRASLSSDNFNPYFKKYDEVKVDEPSMDTDINFDRRSLRIRNVPNVTNQTEFMDNLIQQRISRLYFLKRLEIENKDDGTQEAMDEFFNETVSQFKYINPVRFEMQARQLARKYNVEELIPTQTEEDIYKEVEMFVNTLKVDIKTAPKEQQPVKAKQSRQTELKTLEDIEGEAPKSPLSEDGSEEEEPLPENSLHFQLKNSKELLWHNLNVAEVFDEETIYSNLGVKITDEEKHPVGHIEEDFDRSKEIIVSPNADLEVSLNSLPYSLYKHSDFLIFGLYNEQKGDVSATDILTPSIDPRQKYPRFQFEQPAKLEPRPLEVQQETKVEFYAGGKRKTSKALCRIRSGVGVVKVNRQNIRDYYPDTYFRAEMLKPLLFSGTSGYVDVDFFVSGGGINSQAEACCLALVKALLKYNPKLKGMFRQAGLVTQDPRFVERKHSGHYKARKSYVYVRR